MPSSADQFKHQSLEDTDTVVKYIKALLEGFESRAILFNTEHQNLVLKPQGLISLEIEAKRKEDMVKLNLKFRWSESQTHKPRGRKPLRIQPMNAE